MSCHPCGTQCLALHFKRHCLGQETCPSCLGHSWSPGGLLGSRGEARTRGSPFPKLSRGACFCRQSRAPPRTAPALQADCSNAYAQSVSSRRQQWDCFQLNHHCHERMLSCLFAFAPSHLSYATVSLSNP